MGTLRTNSPFLRSRTAPKPLLQKFSKHIYNTINKNMSKSSTYWISLITKKIQEIWLTNYFYLYEYRKTVSVIRKMNSIQNIFWAIYNLMVRKYKKELGSTRQNEENVRHRENNPNRKENVEVDWWLPHLIFQALPPIVRSSLGFVVVLLPPSSFTQKPYSVNPFDLSLLYLVIFNQAFSPNQLIILFLSYLGEVQAPASNYLFS